jgi:1-deoxy-D-xylulose-5-phosphate reductoisomerase
MQTTQKNSAADSAPTLTPFTGAPRRLTILGATGSIGRSTADVIAAAPGRFVVEAVVGGRDAQALAKMAIELGAACAVLADPKGYQALAALLAGTGIEVGAGPEAVVEAALRPADIIVAAISGAAGVAPTHAALAAGRTIALANKECLVCAGAAFMATAKRSGAQLLPMDSEHNAIHQALGGADPATIETMILTASGGPFRTWTREAIDAATPAQALAHPNWSMGPKISVDSASLMNKGLELIEAHFLFGARPEQMDHLALHSQRCGQGSATRFLQGSPGAVQHEALPVCHQESYMEQSTCDPASQPSPETASHVHGPARLRSASCCLAAACHKRASQDCWMMPIWSVAATHTSWPAPQPQHVISAHSRCCPH